MDYYQLHLLPHVLVGTPKCAPEQAYISSEQRDAAKDLFYTYERYGWFGCLLEGHFDRQIAGPGKTLVTVSFRFTGFRPLVTLVRADSDGKREVCFVSDFTRSKLLSNLRFMAQNGKLEFKPEKRKRDLHKT